MAEATKKTRVSKKAKKTATIPSSEDAEKCFRLHCDCKRGMCLHPDDMRFVEQVANKYPSWYKSLDV